MIVELLTAQYQLHAYGVAYFVTALLITSLSVVTLVKERGGLYGWLYILYAIPLAIWMFGVAGAFFSISHSIATYWVKFAEVGVAYIPTGLFLLSTVVLRTFNQHKRIFYSCIIISTIFAYFVVSGNNYVDGIYEYEWGHFVRFAGFGFFFAFYFAILSSYTISLYWKQYKSYVNAPGFRNRTKELLQALSIGMFASLDFLPAFGIDLPPLGFLFISILFIYTSFIVFKYRLSDITLEEAAIPILTSMHAPIMVINTDGTIKLANDASRFLFFEGKTDIIGHSFEQCVADSNFVFECLTHTINKEHNDTEIDFVDAANDTHHLKLSITPIKDNTGDTISFVFIFHDVTESRLAENVLLNAQEELCRRVDERTRDLQIEISLHEQTEKELVEAKEKAEGASKAKSEFVSTMSHEIRTPLNAVVGMTELLKDTELNIEQKEYLTSIENATATLLSLIGNLLDFSNLESNNLTINKTSIDITAVLLDTIEDFEKQIDNEKVAITINLGERTPPLVFTDERRLKQILVNIIGNAVKFTKRGHINIETDVENDRIQISVSDTGIGFKQEDAEHIFESFFQVDRSNSRSYEGSGLGLTITRDLVTLLGGEISVNSAPGKGSCFRLSLPLELPKEGDMKNNSVPQTGTTKKDMPKFTQVKVLLVEDNIVNQKVASAFLRKSGVKVDLACNGEDAIKVFKNNTYDVVFMDMQMPVMDGVTATREIRAFEAQNSREKTPIIALTANASEYNRTQCLDAGMDDFICKPFKRENIATTLLTWVGPAEGNS